VVLLGPSGRFSLSWSWCMTILGEMRTWPNDKTMKRHLSILIYCRPILGRFACLLQPSAVWSIWGCWTWCSCFCSGASIRKTHLFLSKYNQLYLNWVSFLRCLRSIFRALKYGHHCICILGVCLIFIFLGLEFALRRIENRWLEKLWLDLRVCNKWKRRAKRVD